VLNKIVNICKKKTNEVKEYKPELQEGPVPWEQIQTPFSQVPLLLQFEGQIGTAI